MVEIQLHPSDIRRPVRTFVLDGAQLRLAGLAAMAFVALHLCGLALAPFVALRSREAGMRGEVEAELAESRRVFEERLVQLTALRDRAEAHRTRLAKLSEAYGLPARGGGGGGFPVRPPSTPVPPGSPEAAEQVLRETEQGITVASKFLEEILAWERENADRVRTTPSLSPLPPDGFVLTSAFGYRVSPFTKGREFHNGLDLSISEGTPVVAPSDATVVFAGRFPLSTSVNWWRYGNCVVLDHGGRFQSVYAHLASTSVKSGQKVRAGAVIGKVGSSGWSTSAHLHYEIRVRAAGEAKGFVPVDPRIYMLDCRWDDDAQRLAARRVLPARDEFDPLPIR